MELSALVYIAENSMAGTLHTEEYRALIRALTAARVERGTSQAALAEILGRPPSFVAKVELCERRLDIIEFLVWASAVSNEPLEFLRLHVGALSTRIPG